MLSRSIRWAFEIEPGMLTINNIYQMFVNNLVLLCVSTVLIIPQTPNVFIT